MDSLEKLVEMFRHFPGIGPRQARRFVYYFLTKDPSYIKTFCDLVASVKKDVTECSSCHKFFSSKKREKSKLCDICEDSSRDTSMIAVVAKDVDLEVIEKSGYHGQYFVLGGILPILEKEPEKKIRIVSLESRIKNDKNILEIILALNATPDGEHTSDYLVSFLSPILKEKKIKISYLGRGISTGTELEYADSDTLKNALKNRF